MGRAFLVISVVGLGQVFTQGEASHLFLIVQKSGNGTYPTLLELSECFSHSIGGLPALTGDHVAVGIKCDSDTGVFE